MSKCSTIYESGGVQSVFYQLRVTEGGSTSLYVVEYAGGMTASIFVTHGRMTSFSFNSDPLVTVLSRHSHPPHTAPLRLERHEIPIVLNELREIFASSFLSADDAGVLPTDALRYLFENILSFL